MNSLAAAPLFCGRGRFAKYDAADALAGQQRRTSPRSARRPAPDGAADGDSRTA